MGNLNSLYENSLFLDNLFDFLALVPAMPGNGKISPASPLTEGFRLKDITFSYPGTGKIALKNINLEIKPGETVALVGENGAGKTTLAKLLCRLYDPDGGSISLNGVELGDYRLEELQSQIGAIFQDYMRYWLTARENIGFGNLAKLNDRQTLEAAAKKSGADEIIGKLEKGFETRLGTFWEGSDQLSGGEWQRIALARAFIREAVVLILDEPTASLDARVEFETFQRFRELSAGKMTILISHRFNSVRMADRIIVLEKGGIVEQGTHLELMAREGLYSGLFRMQASGYQV